MNDNHSQSSMARLETASLKKTLNRSELSTLQVFCQTIAAASEASELELLQRLEPAQKRQLWATLPPATRQALQALAGSGGAA